MRFLTILPLFVLASLLSCCSFVEQPVSGGSSPIRSWLFMIYMDGDNNLEPEGIDDMNEMEKGFSILRTNDSYSFSGIKAVVLFDRSPLDYQKNNGNWNGGRIYEIQADSSDDGTIRSRLLKDWGQTDMGDSKTLDRFIQYCRANYPGYEHHCLILWNHGSGIRDELQSSRSIFPSICYDDTSGHSLNNESIQQSISSNYSISAKLDILGMDACQMGMVEVGYEYRNLVKNIVFSPAKEWDPGWDYSLLFGTININDSNRDISKKMVETYRTATQNEADQTMTALDLFFLPDLKIRLDSLASSLYGENKKNIIEAVRNASINYGNNSTLYSYCDLYDFCNRITNEIQLSVITKNAAASVLNNLKESVIYTYGGINYGNYYGPGSIYPRGISLFFPDGNSYSVNGVWYSQVNRSKNSIPYGGIDFCTFDNNGIAETWKELLEAWYDPSGTITPDNW